MSANTTFDCKNVEELPITSAEGRLQAAAAASPAFYNNTNLLKLYGVMLLGCLVPAATLGFDAAMLNGLQSVPSWDSYFDHPRGSSLGLLTSILTIGAVAGTPVVSIVGDTFGRRFGISFGTFTMMIGGLLQGVAGNYATFLISRFIIGFGLVFANCYAPILIAELSHPKDRMIATSLYQTTFYLGSICAAWITFATFSIKDDWAWRIPSLLQIVPASIAMIAVWFLPESPRWLMAKGHLATAKAMLVRYHGNGNENDTLVELEYEVMHITIEQEVALKTPWKQLLLTPGNRRRMLIILLLGIFSQWSGNGLVSYYLTRVLETVGITNVRDQNILNGCLQIFNWSTAVSSAFLTTKLKRRTQFMISVLGMLVIFSFLTMAAGLYNEHQNTLAGKSVIPLLFFFYAFYNLAFNALLYSYPVEFLPYPIRAKGMSVLMFFGKGANLISGYVNPIGLQDLGWKYYNIYVAWLVFEVIMVYWVFVETKGPTLEAIAQVFDKKNDASAHHSQLTAIVRETEKSDGI